jgi:hypothetical protein
VGPRAPRSHASGLVACDGRSRDTHPPAALLTARRLRYDVATAPVALIPSAFVLTLPADRAVRYRALRDEAQASHVDHGPLNALALSGAPSRALLSGSMFSAFSRAEMQADDLRSETPSLPRYREMSSELRHFLAQPDRLALAGLAGLHLAVRRVTPKDALPFGDAVFLGTQCAMEGAMAARFQDTPAFRATLGESLEAAEKYADHLEHYGRSFYDSYFTAWRARATAVTGPTASPVRIPAALARAR